MRVSTFVLIPVKRLSEAKRRLSKVLTDRERRRIVVAMLWDVLRAVAESDLVDGIAVVGSDEPVRRMAEAFGAGFVEDPGGGLNEALSHGTEWCVKQGAKGVLIIPSDLPLITREDVEGVISMGVDERCVVVSPSHDMGTNALLRRPPNVISAMFGVKSVKAHIKEARRRRIPLYVYNSWRLSVDVDDPPDLRFVLERGAGTQTHRLMRETSIYRKLEKVGALQLFRIDV